MSMVRTWKHHKDPHHPVDYGDDGEVIYAVRALKEGKALPHQQTLVWDWLMYVTAGGEGFDDLSYRPGGEEGRRATDFAEGRRFVGLQFRKLLHPAVTPKQKPTR